MKKWATTFVLFFCVQFYLVCATEKDLYLLNIEKALGAYQRCLISYDNLIFYLHSTCFLFMITILMGFEQS